MNRREAWKIIAEGEPQYDGSEYEECKEYIDEYWAARTIVRRTAMRRWWEIWK